MESDTKDIMLVLGRLNAVVPESTLQAIQDGKPLIIFIDDEVAFNNTDLSDEDALALRKITEQPALAPIVRRTLSTHRMEPLEMPPLYDVSHDNFRELQPWQKHGKHCKRGRSY
jgi:hypothetical protein